MFHFSTGRPLLFKSDTARDSRCVRLTYSAIRTMKGEKAVRTGGDAVIRQAISCDICASEKKQTNHWFVAYEQSGELRVSGWNSRNRLRPGSKHLCGQTCLHKLVDEFMAKSISVRTHAAAAEASEVQEQALDVDASLTSSAAYVEVESSARLIAPPTPAEPAPIRLQPGIVTMPIRQRTEPFIPLPEEPARLAARNRRAEAWEREREREFRAIEDRTEMGARRRSSA